MPYIEDPRSTFSTGLVLGLAAFFMLSTGTGARVGHVLEAVLAGMSLVLGVIALAFAETFGAALRHE